MIIPAKVVFLFSPAFGGGEMLYMSPAEEGNFFDLPHLLRGR